MNNNVPTFIKVPEEKLEYLPCQYVDGFEQSIIIRFIQNLPYERQQALIKYLTEKIQEHEQKPNHT